MSIRALFKNKREYERDIIKSQIFGAFSSALQARKAEEGLTVTECSDRLGKDKGATSRLVSEEGNWTIHTIADLATALDVTVEFHLRDNKTQMRDFTPSGVCLRIQEPKSAVNYLAEQCYYTILNDGGQPAGQIFASAAPVAFNQISKKKFNAIQQ